MPVSRRARPLSPVVEAVSLSGPMIRIVSNELTQVAYRALVASGMEPGQAPAAARMILWAEQVDGSGLELLRKEASRPGRLLSQPRLELESPGPLAAILDGMGVSPLCSGPIALDLAYARAEELGVGVAVIRGGAPFPLLGEMVSRATRRGAACLLATVAGDRSGARDQVHFGLPDRVSGAYGTFELPMGSFMAVSPGVLTDDPRDPLGAILGSLRSTSIAKTAGGGDAFHAFLCVSGRSEQSRAVWQAIAARLREGEQRGEIRAVRRADDLDLVLGEAHRIGMAVDRELWFELAALGDRLLVPDFPGSETSVRHLKGLP